MEKTILYALFHFNTKTGEKVRYPKESFPAGEKWKIELDASDSRFGKAVGSAYQDDWITKAFPDV